MEKQVFVQGIQLLINNYKQGVVQHKTNKSKYEQGIQNSPIKKYSRCSTMNKQVFTIGECTSKWTNKTEQTSIDVYVQGLQYTEAYVQDVLH